MHLPPTSVQNKPDFPGPLPYFDSAITVTLYSDPGNNPIMLVLLATSVNFMCF